MNEEMMTKDPEIEARKAEIAATRNRLASGVEELKDRVTPQNVARVAKETARDMAHDAKQAMKDGAHDLAEDVNDGVRRGASGVGRAIRDNPVPSALTALGIGYLVYQSVSNTRKGIGDRETFTGYHGPDNYGGAFGVPLYREPWNAEAPTGHRASSGADAAGEDDEGTRGRLQQAGHRAMEGASQLADRAREGGQHAAEKARRGGQMAKRKTRDAFDAQPLVFGLGAFVAGLAIGAMIPSTDREDELMGAQRDRFVREAKSRAHDAGEVAKEAGRKAVEHVDRQLPSGDESASKDNGWSPGSTTLR